MQSILLSKVQNLPAGAIIYTIPDKVRWDGWWLALPALPALPPSRAK